MKLIYKNSKIVKALSLLGCVLILNSCGTSSNETENIAGTDGAVSSASEKDTQAQNVFYSIPSPIETTSLLKAAGAKYNSKILNPVDNVSKYSAVSAKALNLGIYGADLSFASIFNQTQESMLYLSCANKLAEGLGITGAFDEQTTTRIEANMENRDSLLAIISDSYWNADSYLKDNGQPGVSALIVAGGWIEGLYIGTQIANTTKNEAISLRIAEQKLSLDNLVSLLDKYKKDNTGVANVLIQLNSLKTIYDGVQPMTDAKSDSTKSTTDQKNGVTTVGNGSNYKLTDDQLKQISDKASEIRSKLIQ